MNFRIFSTIGFFVQAACILAQTSTAQAARGQIISTEFLARYDSSQIKQQKQSLDSAELSSLPVRNGLFVYRIIYETIDVDHVPTPASGLMLVPDVSTFPLPIVSYQHGVVLTRSLAPSFLNSTEALLIAAVFGASGYLVAAPDYIGLGTSNLPHPYLHAESEATASADMIIAVREAAKQLNLAVSEHLFLAGYSQGGQATMALQRYLEERGSRPFKRLASSYSKLKVTASAPMAGSYDLSSITIPALLSDRSESSVAYVGYVIEAYNHIYHLFPDLSAVIKAPYDRAISVLFDGNHTADQILQGLPKTPKNLLRQDFFHSVARGDPKNPFIQALRKNDVFRWKPDAPVRLFHGKADHDVPYANSEEAVSWMKRQGADIELINVGDSLDHITAAVPCFLGALSWFEEFRKPSVH